MCLAANEAVGVHGEARAGRALGPGGAAAAVAAGEQGARGGLPGTADEGGWDTAMASSLGEDATVLACMSYALDVSASAMLQRPVLGPDGAGATCGACMHARICMGVSREARDSSVGQGWCHARGPRLTFVQETLAVLVPLRMLGGAVGVLLNGGGGFC